MMMRITAMAGRETETERAAQHERKTQKNSSNWPRFGPHLRKPMMTVYHGSHSPAKLFWTANTSTQAQKVSDLLTVMPLYLMRMLSQKQC